MGRRKVTNWPMMDINIIYIRNIRQQESLHAFIVNCVMKNVTERWQSYCEGIKTSKKNKVSFWMLLNVCLTKSELSLGLNQQNQLAKLQMNLWKRTLRNMKVCLNILFGHFEWQQYFLSGEILPKPRLNTQDVCMSKTFGYNYDI